MRLLADLGKRIPDGEVGLMTDKKTTYPVLAKQVFGDRLTHETTVSTLHRGTHNPLFPINCTLAMSRDNMGRLRRKSWLVSKKHERLHSHAGLFVVYRNYVRCRFNRDRPQRSPAQVLGLLPRQMSPKEVLAWRQDWGVHSVHPMSIRAASSIAAPPFDKGPAHTPDPDHANCPF